MAYGPTLGHRGCLQEPSLELRGGILELAGARVRKGLLEASRAVSAASWKGVLAASWKGPLEVYWPSFG
eukprot:2091060-Pyramimonas_sp.AAC.1